MIRASIALALMLSASAVTVYADDAVVPESASDATTPMDRKAGNLNPPTDNTLSNEEVKQLQHESGSAVQPVTGTMDAGGPVPSVSGTTATYKEKSGSAAKTEGGDGQ